jgi:hypothetical protein
MEKEEDDQLIYFDSGTKHGRLRYAREIILNSRYRNRFCKEMLESNLKDPLLDDYRNKGVTEETALEFSRTYATYERGTRKIPKFVIDFMATKGIDTEWLITGSGSPKLGESVPSVKESAQNAAEPPEETAVPEVVMKKYETKLDECNRTIQQLVGVLSGLNTLSDGIKVLACNIGELKTNINDLVKQNREIHDILDKRR